MVFFLEAGIETESLHQIPLRGLQEEKLSHFIHAGKHFYLQPFLNNLLNTADVKRFGGLQYEGKMFYKTSFVLFLVKGPVKMGLK